ncbi:MAG: tol-pal system protein YbgF [bacterium]
MLKLASAIAAIVSVGIVYVSAANAGGTEDRVSALEKQVALIQSTRTNNNAEVASSLSRMQAIQDEFTSVKGQVEASEVLLKRQYEELGKRLTEIDQRVAAIEDRLSIFSTQLSRALGKVAPEAAAEGDMYQKALDMASSNQYLEAAAAFTSFIQKFPKSTYVPSATYWIAECFYSMRDYARAVKEYQNFLSKFPRDEKAPDALLKQGNGFYELGMPDEARTFYDKVISTYPRSAAAAQAQSQIARIEKRKAGGAAQTPSQDIGSYPTETLEQQMKRRADSQSDLAPQPQPTPKAGQKAQPDKGNTRNPVRDF